MYGVWTVLPYYSTLVGTDPVTLLSIDTQTQGTAVRSRAGTAVGDLIKINYSAINQECSQS